MLLIMIVGGPAEAYISNCLDSLTQQSCTDWRAQVVLDPTGDKTYEKSLKWQSDKLKIVLNEKKQFAIPNFKKAIELLKPNDEDILVTLDADDWLASTEVLSIVKRYYEAQSDLLLTHGSWRAYPNPNVNTNNAPYTENEFKNNIRKFGWRASHLRTFKYKLWKHVRDEDLKGPRGEYFRSAWDLAMMFPMIEMSGLKRIRFIPDILYIYNQETPYSDARMRLMEQMFYTQYIAAKPPYNFRSNL